MDLTEEFTPLVRDQKGRFYMDDSMRYTTMDQIDIGKITKFYYDYIQGDIEEYRWTEPHHESYEVDGDWKRRLSNTTRRSLQEEDQVGKFTLIIQN